jgi:thioredoxin reductase (NADPH)
MIDRSLNNPKIDIIKNVVVSDIFGSQKDGVSGVLLTNTLSEEESKFNCDGVFYAIGHNPNTKHFQNVLDLDEQGYIQTKGKSTTTNIPGIFACGDVQDSYYRQAVTAAGTGCMAAMDAEKYLESL